MGNGTIVQFFHWYFPADGRLWNHAKEKAAELAAWGVTAVWLPPAFKGREGANSSGYDAYDLYDLGEFHQKGSVKTKYGAKVEYGSAIHALNGQGVTVYADIVLNHKAGADKMERIPVIRVDPEDRTHFIEPLEIDAYTLFTFPGRHNRYSSFRWDWHCFSGVDCAVDLDQNSIFKIRNEYSYSWDEVVAREKGNYDYLMFADIEFRNPAVREELKRWGGWFLQEAPFGGVRLDAVKHMSPAFINEWLDHMRTLKSDLFAVGEYWAPEDLSIMREFLEATQGRMALFDAPLHNNFFIAGNKGREYDLTGILKNCLVDAHPQLAVTLVDNHDTQPLQMLESPVQAWFKPLAYALILLREAGYPCVFYPDLYGAHYVGKGSDGSDLEVWLEKCPNLDKLLMSRKQYAYGPQRDYFDAPNCVGWTRQGTEEYPGSGCAVVLSNGDEHSKKMEMGVPYAGKSFIDYLGGRKEQVIVDSSGWGEFPVSGGSVSVWVRKQ